jgi:hypothetical protein
MQRNERSITDSNLQLNESDAALVERFFHSGARFSDGGDSLGAANFSPLGHNAHANLARTLASRLSHDSTGTHQPRALGAGTATGGLLNNGAGSMGSERALLSQQLSNTPGLGQHRGSMEPHPARISEENAADTGGVGQVNQIDLQQLFASPRFLSSLRMQQGHGTSGCPVQPSPGVPAALAVSERQQQLHQHEQQHQHVQTQQSLVEQLHAVSSQQRLAEFEARRGGLCNQHSQLGGIFSANVLSQFSETAAAHDKTAASQRLSELHRHLVQPGVGGTAGATAASPEDPSQPPHVLDPSDELARLTKMYYSGNVGGSMLLGGVQAPSVGTMQGVGGGGGVTDSRGSGVTSMTSELQDLLTRLTPRGMGGGVSSNLQASHMGLLGARQEGEGASGMDATYTTRALMPPGPQQAQAHQATQQQAQMMDSHGVAFALSGSGAGSEGEVQPQAGGASPARHTPMQQSPMSVAGFRGGSGVMDVLDGSTGSHRGLHQQVMHECGGSTQEATRDVVTHEDLVNLMR